MAENNKKLCDFTVNLHPVRVLSVLANMCFDTSVNVHANLRALAMSQVAVDNRNEQGGLVIHPEDVPAAFAKEFSACLLGSHQAVVLFACGPNPVMFDKALVEYCKAVPEAIAADKAAVMSVLSLAAMGGIDEEVTVNKVCADIDRMVVRDRLGVSVKTRAVEWLVNTIALAINTADIMENKTAILRRLG